jgi:hypothetical protein
LKKFLFKPETWLRLGFKNVITVAMYRFLKRIGYYRYLLPIGASLKGPFLSDSLACSEGTSLLRYFSYHDVQVPSPPDWWLNPWRGTRSTCDSQHWSEISDFESDLGDIKTIWEASRFDWLARMAWEYQQGSTEKLPQLELWLHDWVERNPVNLGINWKCGQEASFRCLNLLVAALFIDDRFDKPRKGFVQLLFCHLQRIGPTLRYAMAQDNNHGVSEAAALFLVGQYLCINGNQVQQKLGRKSVGQGRYWLQDRIKRLVMVDGSFSQHSVIYHRLMLDILSLVELLRTCLDERPFEQSFYVRIGRAILWLQGMTDTQTGDAPNLGGNDGAYLFNLAGGEYRDFRPSVQLAAAVFLKKSAWPNKVCHPLLDVFGVDVQKLPSVTAPESSIMVEGGYACIRNENGFAVLRLPVYHFRPCHADGLHLDLWHKGVNWVRDAGTYSYNADADSLNYFPGTASHSTVCFDNRDQMLRLGRFLFGAWLKADEIEWLKEERFVRSGYTDYLGACHIRSVCYLKDSWIVIDTLSGFKNEAVIRWHLSPEDWQIDDFCLSCEKMKLQVETDSKVTMSLEQLPESSYYLEQHQVPVLEIRCLRPGTIKTIFTFIE